MRIDKKIHPVWLDWQWAQRKRPDLFLAKRGPIIGKWQYIYESDDGRAKISLVELPNYFLDGVTFWEIYCLEGDLFEDIERFNSKKEAEEEIKKILEKPERLEKPDTDLDQDTQIEPEPEDKGIKKDEKRKATRLDLLCI